MDPLHITEFASERYFSKLKQLKETPRGNDPPGNSLDSTEAHEAPTVPTPGNTFVLSLGRQRSRETESQSPSAFKPSDQKKRSLGHDLTALRTQRRPTFTGSFGKLRSKVTIINKASPLYGHHTDNAVDDLAILESLTLSTLFLSLPNELHVQIIAPLSVHDVLTLRLVSKSFHTLVTMNEPSIARFHMAHTLPPYAVQLYPPPDALEINLHYLCSIWHRLHVALKLSTRIAAQATKEIFLRDTPARQLEFEPQHQRMRQRLVPLVFTLFHFFETYRTFHIQHLASNGVPLHLQPFTLNPIECQVMAMYDDQTLLKVHQVFPLVVSAFSRRLRPPSYAGRLERSIKGYLKERPADEVYATILAIGGLRQAQRFWETKGYNSRRAAVDTWYGFITRSPVEAQAKSKLSLITNLGRKKGSAATQLPHTVGDYLHDGKTCNEWFCVKPNCQTARRRHSTDNLVFHSSLAAGPPMGPLSREQLRLMLPDLQHLSSVWMHTAEALIMDRKIVERPQDIKRNTQVLLELIREGGSDGQDQWIQGARSSLATLREEQGLGSSGGLSD